MADQHSQPQPPQQQPPQQQAGAYGGSAYPPQQAAQWGQQQGYYDASYYNQYSAYYPQQAGQQAQYPGYYSQQPAANQPPWQPPPPSDPPPPGVPAPAPVTSAPAPPASAPQAAAGTGAQPPSGQYPYTPSQYQQYQQYYGQPPNGYDYSAYYQQQGYQSAPAYPPPAQPAQPSPPPWQQPGPAAASNPWQGAAAPQPPSYAAVASGSGNAHPAGPAPPSTQAGLTAAKTQGLTIKPQMSKGAMAARAGTSAPSYTKVQQADAKLSGPKSWPPSLRNYVERAFLRCKTPVDRSQIEAELKNVINQAEASGELWTRNWDTAALPGASRAAAGKSAVDISQSLNKAKAVAQAKASAPANTRLQHVPVQKRKWMAPAPEPDSSDDEDDPEAARRKAGRAARFGAGHAKGAVQGHTAGKGKNKGNGVKYKYMQAGIVSKANIAALPGEEIDWSAHTIKGTCQTLEKSYFRLTSAPEPGSVRPEHVLRRALERLLRLLKDKSENYFYAQDQFKAMRQDCTVQHIRNAFTVEVYEAHARAALEYGEMGDYIQCQTKLNELYGDGLPGCRDEFAAYYLLHLVAHSQLSGDDGAMQRTSLMDRLRRLSKSDKRGLAVSHALKVRAATAEDNAAAFFRLKICAPNLGGRLMDVQVEQMRFTAIKVLSRSFKPSLAVDAIARMLGFSTSDGSDDSSKSCIEWLLAHGAVVIDVSRSSEAKMDCKESSDKLFIPERDNACAHGDANLVVDDFMKRTTAE